MFMQESISTVGSSISTTFSIVVASENGFLKKNENFGPIDKIVRKTARLLDWHFRHLHPYV